ncbi:MAG: TolC family protein [Synergistaceae bacterium]|nr:TolC family protein [Synergistaceae bacterium]
MMMTNKAILALVILLTLNTHTVYADDWLELVQKYTSADKINFAPSKWDKLINESSGRKDKNINILAQWWETFNDPTLTELIGRAFANNKDIQTSRAKVQEARAQLGLSMADASPRVDGSGTWTHSEPSKNIPNAGSSNNYHLGFDASWELDLWGKKQDNINASKAAYEAEYASLHNAWVSLSAEVAGNYINLRTFQERIKIAENNINLQQDMLNLTQSQFDAGLKDELAVKQSRYTLERTKSTLPALRQQIEEIMNALAILTGEVPGSINELLNNNNSFPEVDVNRLNGIPAETIRQRPDIIAAERNLAAQRSRKKAAQKDYYPTITLTGSIGLDSLHSSTIFEGHSIGSTFLPRLSWPIFNGGQIRKNIKVQTAREEQMLAAYEKTVLSAVSEVRNALTSNVQEEIRNQSLQSALNSAHDALNTARDKYEQGLTDFNSVLNAMESVNSIENDLASSNGQRMLNLITLFKALGGGWQPMM